MSHRGLFPSIALSLCGLTVMFLWHPPAISAQWAKSFGGEDFRDQFQSITASTDGGYATVGWSNAFSSPHDQRDLLVIKVDASGTLEWNRDIGLIHLSGGETYSLPEYGQSIIQTSDEGYLVSGTSQWTGGGYRQALLAKLDSFGNVTWIKTYLTYGAHDTADDVLEASDGGYVFAGHTAQSGPGMSTMQSLTKVTSSGLVEWKTTAGGSLEDTFFSVDQALDGGYIAVGHTASYGAGDFDFLVVKFDANGHIQWAKTFGGALEDAARSVRATPDGGFVVAGYGSSYGGADPDFIVLKLGNDGAIQWQRRYDSGGFEYLYDIEVVDDGYVLAGGMGGVFTAVTMKIDLAGAIVWQNTFGGFQGNIFSGMAKTLDGGFVCAGHSGRFSAGAEEDALIVRLAADGTCADCPTLRTSTYLSAFSVSVAANDITSLLIEDHTQPTPATPYDYFVLGDVPLTQTMICPCSDDDSDGFLAEVCDGDDCDDTNPDVNPGAIENCSNELDDDCDGLVDMEDQDCLCNDADGDGYGAPASVTCGHPELDCDDTNPDVNPGAAEICTGGFDEDCDGLIDCDDVLDCPAGTWGPCPGNVTSSTVGGDPFSRSWRINNLSLLLIPIGAVIALRIIRRKK